MKIAISCSGKSVESEVDSRFGRCPYFVIVEVDKNSKEIKDKRMFKNTAKNQSRGAGITASESVSNQGVEIVIVPNIGPRAFSALNQLNIDVYRGSGKIKEVVKKFLDEKLEKIEQSTGPGN